MGKQTEEWHFSEDGAFCVEFRGKSIRVDYGTWEYRAIGLISLTSHDVHERPDEDADQALATERIWAYDARVRSREPDLLILVYPNDHIRAFEELKRIPSPTFSCPSPVAATD